MSILYFGATEKTCPLFKQIFFYYYAQISLSFGFQIPLFHFNLVTWILSKPVLSLNSTSVELHLEYSMFINKTACISFLLDLLSENVTYIFIFFILSSLNLEENRKILLNRASI